MYAEERQQAIADLVGQRGRRLGRRPGAPVRRHHRDGPPRPVRPGAARTCSAGCTAAPSRPGRSRAGDRPQRPRPRQHRREGPDRRRRARPAARRRRHACCSTPAPPPPGWPACSPATCELTVFTHAVPIAARLARLPPRRPAPAARPGPRHHPGGRRRPRPSRRSAGSAPTSPSSAPTASPSATGSPPPTATRPPPSGRWSPAAQQVVVLADSTKIGLESTVRFADARATSTCWSPTTGSPAPTARRFDAAGLEVVVA